MSIVAGLLGVIVGAFLAAWLSWVRDIKDSRIRQTLSLVEEFHSRQVLEARHLAKATLVYQERGPVSIKEHKDKGGDEWIAISAMLHYFDKVEALLEARLVDYKLVDRLMGRYVRAWTQYLGPSYLLLDFYRGPENSRPGSLERHPLNVSLERLSRRFHVRPMISAISAADVEQET